MVTLLFRASPYKTESLESVLPFSQMDFAGEAVPLEGRYAFLRERLERELSITRFNLYQFVLYHKREPVYFPFIEAELRKAGVPDDFKYLAVAESGLRNDIASAASAG